MKERGTSMKNDYLNPTQLNDDVENWLDELVKYQRVLDKRIDRYPEGKLHLIHTENRVQYYLRTKSDDKSGKYISKSDDKKLKVYMQKKYDEAAMKILAREINDCKRLSMKMSKIGQSSYEELQNIFAGFPKETRQYIEPVALPDEEYVTLWLSEEYERKAILDDAPMYVTMRGDRVRSKSELNIANTLYKYGIPYKYEYPFIMKNGRRVYPDFIVLNVRKRKEIYWEHRGMMDDRDYSRNAVFKNKEYLKAGLVLGNDLVITEETSMLPLGTDEIESVIRNYFL